MAANNRVGCNFNLRNRGSLPQPPLETGTTPRANQNVAHRDRFVDSLAVADQARDPGGRGGLQGLPASGAGGGGVRVVVAGVVDPRRRHVENITYRKTEPNPRSQRS